MIQVGIVGGTGYTGGELLRLLSAHPEVVIKVITSRSEAGRSVPELFPGLRGHIDLHYSSPDIETLKTCDLVLFATPNGVAMQQVPELLEHGVRVIDLAADFRLRNSDDWRQWYGSNHSCPELLAKAVYGLPEINRKKIANARLVANPGCYPTATQLGLLPLIEIGLVDGTIIVDAKSGVSGAGRGANVANLLCETSESFKAYGVAGHRHLPEIRQGIGLMAKGNTPFEGELVFVPHLTPMVRGIHATIYCNVKDRSVNLQKLFELRYKDELFVDVMPERSHPETRSVKTSNHCRIAVHRPQDGDTVVILAVIDNLVKGAAGQAVQNMNNMFGVSEVAGLISPGLTL